MFGRTKKEITIREKYEKNLWTAEVDKGQIEQVILNLYINAWQAMPAGGDLYIQTQNVIFDEKYTKPYQVKPGNYVKISITE
jgi:signal transduction histidine kinase